MKRVAMRPRPHLMVGMGVGVLVIGIVLTIVYQTKETSVTTFYESSLGFGFSHSDEWVVENLGDYLKVFWKAQRYYTHRSPEVAGRYEREFLFFNRSSLTFAEELARIPKDKRRTLKCNGGRTMPMMDNRPYSDLYYLELRSGKAVVIGNDLPGMAANNLISQQEKADYEKKLIPIVCSVRELSDADKERVSKHREPTADTEKSEPPADIVNKTSATGWFGVSSKSEGFTLYSPPGWTMKFVSSAPVDRYNYLLTPEEVEDSDYPETAITVNIIPRQYAYGAGEIPEDTRDLHDTGMFGGQRVDIFYREYVSHGEGPGEEPGVTKTILKASTQYVFDDVFVRAHLWSSETARRQHYQTFKEILSAMEIFDAAERPMSWTQFDDDSFQYHFRYPDYMRIQQEGRNYVTLIGPVLDNAQRNWPMVGVYPSEFIVPLGSNVLDVVKDKYDSKRLFALESMSFEQWSENTEERFYSSAILIPEPDFRIDDASMAHYRIPATNTSWAADFFFVVNYNTLFQFKFVHVGGKEDWDLYSAILDSIDFEL